MGKKLERKDLESKYSRVAFSHSLPWWSLFVAFSSIGLMTIISKYIHLSLPTPLSNDTENIGKFIAENAWLDLKELTSIGVRFAGSHENEVLAVRFLLRKINDIKKNTHFNKTIEIDHQIVSGSYMMKVFGIEMTGVYVNVQNIVVKLHGDDTKHAVMLNCHFDTAPGSPGASDDAANCAIMLELLRIFAVQDTKLKHSVIFLFNGAEETGLQASHGFITQHKWAKEVRAFVNLESAGSGGKEILFQAGPKHPWLIEKYSHVPHPSAQTAGEEIFQSELIPSDTDFRIFRDHGHIPGLDFAHTHKGYRYHTKYDSIRYIRPNFLQHTGDNVLELVRQIANSDELPKARTLEAGHTIFYDLFGVVFLHYDNLTANISHSFIAIFSVLVPILYWRLTHSNIHRLLRLSLIGSCLVVVELLASLLGAFAVSSVINLSGKSLSWYGYPLLSYLIYGSLTLSVSCTVYIIGSRMLPKKYRELSILSALQGYVQGVTLFWSSITLLMIASGIRSNYIFCIILTITLFCSIFVCVFRVRGYYWIYSFILFQVLVFLFAIWASGIFVSILIPIMGRTGYSNSEVKIAVLVCLTTFLTTSYLIPMIILLRRHILLTSFLYTCTFIVTTLICTTNVGFPFVAEGPTTEPRVQRHYVTHTMRTFYDLNQTIRHQDSGYWFREMEYRTKPVLDSFLGSKKLLRQDHSDVCRNEPLCALPLWQRFEIGFGGYWMWGNPPKLHPKNELQINQNVKVDSVTRRINLNLTENIYSTIILRSRYGPMTIEIFSATSASIGKHTFNEVNETHYLQFTHGLRDRDKLTLDVEVKSNSAVNIADKWLDLILVSIFIDPQEEYLHEFKKLLKSFPKWTFVVPMVANINGYQF